MPPCGYLAVGVVVCGLAGSCPWYGTCVQLLHLLALKGEAVVGSLSEGARLELVLQDVHRRSG
eukprot:504384-Amphidinium_carterae.1